MLTVLFASCAAAGGALLLCQLVLFALGHGVNVEDVALPHDLPSGDGSFGDFHDGAHDASHDDGGVQFLKVLSLQTLVAAATFFGLTGLAGESAQFPATATLTLAILAGFGALYGVHWLMQSLTRLRADGTVRLERAIGARGSVYLRIPADKASAGKIHLNLQNRTVELQAVSEFALANGDPVIVTRVLGPDLVEVERAPASAPTASGHSQPERALT